ncbi:hypothetical protein [Neobacillus ginsengisoli]|uniref:Uncharacterized protein n=1 Tax=Neobacillus ginsengisoli TaxID=904295 RepID=A0ABT9XZY8_9BACI|nr:hypothetical protein [Neobacillus ginsengisoli]MDQ0201137.1 hypothetical protein [Neobacillus ginsengisoli]
MDIEQLNELTIEELKEINIEVLNKIISNKQRDLEECEQELKSLWNHNGIMEKALITFKVNLQEDLERYNEKLSLALKDSN